MNALLRLLRDPQGFSSAIPVIDQAELVDDSRRHGLSALVHHHLHATDQPLDASCGKNLALDARRIIGSGLRVKSLLTRSLDVLSAIGVTPVILKGAGLGARLYPRAELRPMTDVDLLISITDFTKAVGALRASGLTSPRSVFEQVHSHHLSLTGPAGVVELHFAGLRAFGTELAAEPLIGSSLLSQFEGRPVRYLAPVQEMTFLAAHAAHHLFERIGWLYDLKLLAANNANVDWELVRRVSKQAKLENPVALSLGLSRAILGGQIPENFGSRWGPYLFNEKRLIHPPWSRHTYFAAIARTLLASSPTLTARALLKGIRRIRARQSVQA